MVVQFLHILNFCYRGSKLCCPSRFLGTGCSQGFCLHFPATAALTAQWTCVRNLSAAMSISLMPSTVKGQWQDGPRNIWIHVHMVLSWNSIVGLPSEAPSVSAGTWWHWIHSPSAAQTQGPVVCGLSVSLLSLQSTVPLGKALIFPGMKSGMKEGGQ